VKSLGMGCGGDQAHCDDHDYYVPFAFHLRYLVA
jgi:hypothetical protein